ncbi:MAG: 1-acyl-sn-glycerol-3-phosphate acyltransferase [Spirochaetia bacterium]|nr:1-acyl-sn-glycerol-3-phosphate acyltransferase [Spirochaetia bacterium]
MQVFISISFWLFLGISCISLFPIALLIRFFTGLFDRRLTILHQFTCFWASLYTWFNPFWSVSVVNRTRIDPKSTYMMVSNHQSMVDIFALFRTFFHFKWVSKIENFKFPFVGWNMYLNKYIPIHRGSVKGGAEMMRVCEATLRKGSSLFIFPEGTRSLNGELGIFKRGAFDLAKRAEVPILPVALDGSSRALPKGSIVLSGLHRIRIHVLEPIPVEKVRELSVEDLMKLAREIIGKELSSMRSAELAMANG